MSKSLVKKMSYAETERYCNEHPAYKIPSPDEAESLDDQEHNKFWINEELGGRKIVYLKKEQRYQRTHPSFLHNVVLVKV